MEGRALCEAGTHSSVCAVLAVHCISSHVSLGNLITNKGRCDVQQEGHGVTRPSEVTQVDSLHPSLVSGRGRSSESLWIEQGEIVPDQPGHLL